MQAENRLLTSLLWCACSYLIIKRGKTSHFTDKNTRNKKKKSVIWLRSHRLARGSKLTNYSLHVISLPWLLRAVSRNQRVLFHYSYVLLLRCIIMLQSMAQHLCCPDISQLPMPDCHKAGVALNTRAQEENSRGG